ncbi:MAG: glucose-6-phosphate isomerase [Deltaproteobacteria bacterium]|nr:glucose-6-phosphate isomerase [Deltaproteobacteria bacterium]
MEIDFEGLFTDKEKEEWQSLIKKTEAQTDYPFVNTIYNEKLFEDIDLFVKEEIEGKYENFVQIGIGGSALGARVFAETCGKNRINFICLDNIDPARIKKVFSLDLDKTFFHIVSKSGNTAETLSLLMLIYEKLGEKIGKQVAFSTSSKTGALWKIKEDLGIDCFYIPDDVGGRFSCFTSVGLLAAKACGIDIMEIINGAKKAIQDLNLSKAFACAMYMLYKNNKNILVCFVYKDNLVCVSDWFRQLWAESLGKNGYGQTPITTLGVTDQHSQLQLYQDGPKDKVIVFLDVKQVEDINLPKTWNFEPFSLLSGKTLSHLMDIERRSTRRALTENGVSTMEIILDRFSPYEIGRILMFFMLSVPIAAKFLNINPFNQPGVEQGKIYTKAYLKEEI